MLKHNRFLITGGAGFLGSAIARQLLGHGAEAVLIDNFSSGSFRNIEQFSFYEKCTFVYGDVRNDEHTGRLVEDCDAVVHLAANHGAGPLTADAMECVFNNLKCTEIVLRLAWKYGKRVFLASDAGQPYVQAGQPLTPGAAKIVDEYASSLLAARGLDIVVGRFRNIIGPQQTSRFAGEIPAMISCALDDFPIIINSGPDIPRSYCAAGDAAEAVGRLLDSDNIRGYFDIVGGGWYTLRRLAGMIVRMSGSRSVIHAEPPPGMPPPESSDTTTEDLRITSETGWRPKIPIESVIGEMIEYERIRRDRYGTASGAI
ncbi:MAG: NAD-dependent epimerase/dehydratase family protein [Candidatus Kapaibacterium sp.]